MYMRTRARKGMIMTARQIRRKLGKRKVRKQDAHTYKKCLMNIKTKSISSYRWKTPNRHALQQLRDSLRHQNNVI